jgi:hypothetical protein
MTFVGIEINDSKVSKISGNTIVSASKDSVGIKINNSDDTVASDKDNVIIAGKTIVVDSKDN